MNKEDNPWKTLNKESVFENPWIKLIDSKVINPAGNPTNYTTVSFKNIAIGIIPLDEQNNTWIVGQYRFPLDIYSWEIPMGGGPLNEPILDAAKRELLEETGIQASNWEEVMTLHTSNSVTDETGKVFLARNLTFSTAQPEETEVLQVRKLPFEDVFQMVKKGQITDAISVAGILMTKTLLSNN